MKSSNYAAVRTWEQQENWWNLWENNEN